MKKTRKRAQEAKKLNLSRETLRLLDRSGLEHAAGGIFSMTCHPNTYTTCGTHLCQPHTNTC